MGNDFLPFALPDIGEDEINEVVHSLRSGWLTTGPKTRRFEKDFSEFLGGDREVVVQQQGYVVVALTQRRTTLTGTTDEAGWFSIQVDDGHFLPDGSTDGPKVIEFNARFGDPEAMNVLSLLESDFSAIVRHIIKGDLSPSHVRFANQATVCKYLVPEGYPAAPVTHAPLTIGDSGDALLYYANVEEQDGTLYTRRSRTLAFVGRGETLDEAETIAETAASSVSGRVFHRRDIGTREVLDRRCRHMKEIA